jgi:hypothetical protein
MSENSQNSFIDDRQQQQEASEECENHVYVDEQGFQICSLCGALNPSQNLFLVTDDQPSISAQEQHQSSQLESQRSRASQSNLRMFVNKREGTYASKMQVSF